MTPKNALVKGVNYSQNWFMQRNPLNASLQRLDLLRRANVDYIPVDGKGKTIRTRPLIEDDRVDWSMRYLEAAVIYLTNPLCFSATQMLADSVAEGDLIVQEKQGYKWVRHDENPLSVWIEQPNDSMDKKEFIRAYVIHLKTFGKIYSVLFQQGDILPNGLISDNKNQFDIVYPARIVEDFESIRTRIKYWYLPIGVEEPIVLNNEAIFTDVIYNPIAHATGVSSVMNPLRGAFLIHKLYMRQIERFFLQDATPAHVLTRIIDINKEPTLTIDDTLIDEAVDRLYAQVGQGGRRPNGLLGLRGDWRITPIGSKLPELMSADLLQYLETLIRAVYGIPASIFWSGLKSSNQRASRQQDSIDFYATTIHNLHERVAQRLGNYLVPRALNKTTRQFRLHFDVTNSPNADYFTAKQDRRTERQWQLKIMKRGETRTSLRLPNDGLTEAELNEYYDGGEANLNAGAGEEGQSIEDKNGLE